MQWRLWLICGKARFPSWRRETESMFRWIIILLVLGVVAFAAGWLADNPGSVTLDWLDYQITQSVALLIVEVVVLVAIAVVLFRLWRSIARSPRSVKNWRNERRQRQGYEAMSRGFVAVAAGDGETATRHARRAEALIDDRPLTMLLSAQAAQLQGDDKAAEKFFTAMLDRPSTEFLGVRGLLGQALKREDWKEALGLARRAHRLNPKSEWVTQTLYDLQKKTGEWEGATATLEESAKRKLIPPGQLPPQRAALLHNSSLEATGADATRLEKKAFDADPSFVPAAVRYARLLIAEGNLRKAAGVIEQAWRHNPDPELAEVYYLTRKSEDALQKVEAAKRLAKSNPNHAESRINVASAALEARLWGEARKSLEPLTGEDASPRVCRLMAELEESEHGDLARARTWLMRATDGGQTADISPLKEPIAGPAR
jgi:HemY protein